MIEPDDDQGTILRWDDHIVPILEHSDIHIRNKALVAVAWESHAHPSELHRLSFGDVEARDGHVAILLSRRDGRERLLTLCGSMPYLKRWMQAEHPVTESLAPDADPLKDAAPETPIWTQTQSNTEISFAQLGAITKRACVCANIPTEFTLHDIRRSRVVLLAIQLGLRPSAIRERFGWDPHENEESVELSGNRNLDDAIGSQPPVRCPACGEWTPQHQPCLWCENS